MDRTTYTVAMIICALLFAGGLMAAFHPDYGYEARFSTDGDILSYSLSSTAPAEYNLVLTDNQGKTSVDRICIYYDEAYGATFPEYESVVEQLESRFSDRGMRAFRADTDALAEMMRSPPSDTGILMGTGTIPEGLIPDMMGWVQAGGTLYWTYDVIGRYVGNDDGTYHRAEESMEAGFLSAECTVMERGSSYSKEAASGYSQALGLKNKEMLGSLDISLISVPYLSIGYRMDGLSEITLLECGNGTVCVVSGDHDMYQITDTVQVVCSGLTERSVLLSAIEQHTHLHHDASGEFPVRLDPGDEYVVYAYVEGLNPPFGKTVRLTT